MFVELGDIAAGPDDLSPVRLVKLFELAAVVFFQLSLFHRSIQTACRVGARHIVLLGRMKPFLSPIVDLSP